MQANIIGKTTLCHNRTVAQLQNLKKKKKVFLVNTAKVCVRVCGVCVRERERE